MTSGLPKISVAETLAGKIVALQAGALPAATTRKCEDLLIDVVGLCVTARNEDYIASALGGCDDDGPCTVIGHQRTLTASGAAFVNGTAAHGEDFDDTFEGGPVHAGAVIVPAVLAACERHNPDGRMALTGIAVGTEVLCRLSLVVPKAVHKAGFHPTAVFGAMGAAAGVGAALGLNARQIVDALGIAGSMAGGIIEYLAEGAWTKRLHAGWAAQSGIRAALLARQGFVGPRTVFEGVHGLFHGFAHTTNGRLRRADRRFRHPLGHRHAGVQALSLRDDGAALHRLRAAAGRARHQGRRYQRDRLRGRGGDGAPAVGAARRQAAAAQRLCRQVRGAVSAGDRLCPWRRRARRLHGNRDPRRQSARACGKSEIRDRPAKSLSEQLYRPYPGDPDRRQRGRGTATLLARRRAGAADPAGRDRTNSRSTPSMAAGPRRRAMRR